MSKQLLIEINISFIHMVLPSSFIQRNDSLRAGSLTRKLGKIEKKRARRCLLKSFDAIFDCNAR